MRWSLARAIAVMVGGSLVMACAASTSPAPVASPPPTGPPSASAGPLPTATPVVDPAATTTPPSGPTEWPFALGNSTSVVRFAPDGTAYVLTSGPDSGPPRLNALDRGGRLKPGWPVVATPGTELMSLDVGPDGSAYVTDCGAPSPGVGCLLHRLDATGREMPGWPFEVSEDFACDVNGDYCYVLVTVAPDGAAWLNRGHEEGGLNLMAIDPSGAMKPGWPVDMDDYPGSWSGHQIRSDGAVFVVWRPIGRPSYEEDGIIVDDVVELWAFSPDGKPLPGWPVSVPNLGGYTFGPQGTVVAWTLIDLVGELCAGSRRTVFTILDSQGRTMPGWPRGSTGFSSGPVVGADGTVYFITAQGNAYAFDGAGATKPAWPVAVPGALPEGCGTAGPHLAPDGTIYLLGNEVAARSPDGGSRAGWPYEPAGELSWPCIGVDCGPLSAGPAFGPDGTVYLIVYHPDPGGAWMDVVALDREARLKPGWPVRLSIDPTVDEVYGLSMSPDGRLVVLSRNALLALDGDGSISD